MKLSFLYIGYESHQNKCSHIAPYVHMLNTCAHAEITQYSRGDENRLYFYRELLAPVIQNLVNAIHSINLFNSANVFFCFLFFCVRQVYLPTNLGVCKSTFYTFIHQILGETVLSIIQTFTECSILQFFKTNCTPPIFRTINSGLLAKPFKKSPTMRPAGSPFSQSPNL